MTSPIAIVDSKGEEDEASDTERPIKKAELTLSLPPPVDTSTPPKPAVDGPTSLTSPPPSPTTTSVHVKENTDIDADEEPGIRASSLERKKGSPLLELSAELRNEIVQYALASNKPLHLHRCADQLRLYETEHAKDMPFNQIQNICKQFRFESQHLEWEFNEIVVPGPDFVKMVRTSNKSWESRVRKVEALPRKGPWFDYKNPNEFILHPLIEFCLKRKEVSVSVPLEDLNFAGMGNRTLGTFLNLGSVINSAIRGKEPPLYSYGTDMVKKWQRRKDISVLNADNLRFFPRDHEFDSDRFERLFKSYAAGRKEYMFKLFGVDSVKALMIMIEGWYENGL